MTTNKTIEKIKKRIGELQTTLCCDDTLTEGSFGQMEVEDEIEKLEFALKIVEQAVKAREEEIKKEILFGS